MSQGACLYPISQLISRIMLDAGFDREQFVASLGYRKIDRGCRRLGAWLDQGAGYPRIIKQIAASYPQHAEQLSAALAATQKIRKDESEAAFVARCTAEQATFRPYIHVEGETRVPSSIVMFAVSGGKWNYISIPDDTLALHLPELLAALPQLMQAYVRKHDGQCPFFGKVTGFRFVRCLDYFQFNAEAQLVERVDKPFRRPISFVALR